MFTRSVQLLQLTGAMLLQTNQVSYTLKIAATAAIFLSIATEKTDK